MAQNYKKPISLNDIAKNPINEFVSSMSKSKGFARAAKYEVRIQLPAALYNLQTNWGRQLNLHCDSVSMPGHDLQTQSRQYGSEPARDMATSHAYEGMLQASFYLDTALHERRIFEEWQSMAVSKTTHNANYYDDYAKDTSMTIYQLTSAEPILNITFDERSSDILRADGRSEGYLPGSHHARPAVTAKAKLGQVPDATYAVKVTEIYPATISDVEYNYGSANTILKVNVGFNFKEWKNISHTLRGFQPFDI